MIFYRVIACLLRAGGGRLPGLLLLLPLGLCAQQWTDSCSSYAFYGQIRMQGYSDFSRVHTLPGGDYIAAGTLKGEFAQMAIARNFVQVMRVAADGAMVWSKFIGIRDTAVQVDLRTYSSLITRDGDLVLLVTAAAAQYSGNYILRLDPEGNLRWQRRFAYTSPQLAIDVITAVRETANGLLMVAGYNNNGGVLLLLEADGRLRCYSGIQSGDARLRFTSCTEAPGAYFVTGTGTSRDNNTVTNFVARIDQQQGNTVWIRWINPPGVAALSAMAEFYCSDIQYANGRLAITGNTYFLYNGPRAPAQITYYLDAEGRNTSALRITNPVQPSANGNLFQGALFDPFRMAGVQYLNQSGGDYFVYQLQGADAPYRGWRLQLPDIQCANDSRLLPDSSLLVGGFRRDSSNTVMAALLKTDPTLRLPGCNATAYTPLAEPASFTLQDIPNTLTSLTTADQLEPAFLDTLSGRGFQWVLTCSSRLQMKLGKIRGPAVLCTGSAGLFRATVQGTAAALQFSSNVPVQVEQVGDSAARLLFSGSGLFPVIATLRAPCGLLRDTFWVTVTAAPEKLSLGPDTLLCSGVPLRLEAPGFSSYRWQDGSTASFYEVTRPGIYHLSVRDACGNNLSDTIRVDAAPPVSFSLGADRTVCPGDTLLFTAPPGFRHYQWGPAGYTGNPYTQNMTVVAENDLALFVQAERWPGCAVADTVQIKVWPVPRILLGRDTFVCSGQTLLLDAGEGFRAYRWNNGASGPVLHVSEPGWYAVEAVSVQGCVRRDTLTVRVGNCSGFINLPRAFSPDDNGRNDRFRALMTTVPARFTLRVFDRWGREVFVSNNPAEGWDGRSGGRPAPPGVYLWICRYRFAGRGEQEQKGTVLLIR